MDLSRTEGTVNVDGVRLAWLRIGAPSGSPRTLVLLHEGLGCNETWRSFPEALAGRTGLPVFAYSRAGYGQSDPVPLPRPVDYLHREAEVLPQVLSAAEVNRCVLIGHSDGGSIALLHGASDGAGAVDGIVTVAAHVFNEDITVRGIKETAGNYEKGDLRHRLARYHGANVDVAFCGWRDVWLSPAFRSWNIESALPRVRCPLLVIQGEDDGYGSKAQVDAIAAQVAGPVETAMLAECGHAPHLECPGRVLEAIAAFISGLPR
jgi:pimeloyl-ACP methyl ester carboxylesterase